MNTSDKHYKPFFTYFQLSIMLFLLFSSIIIISILVINQKSMEERVMALEDEVYEQFIKKTEILLDSESVTAEMLLAAFDLKITEMTAEIGRYITSGAKADGNRINLDNTRIQEINALYTNLLAEQQKRTLDSNNTPQVPVVVSTPQVPVEISTPQIRDSITSQQPRDGLYTQQAILEMEQDAARLFRDGKYAMASAQYAAIVKEQPDNTDARFFQLYSLFLNNKLDRGNYRQIKEGLEALERYGYYRLEIKEILEYIASEEDDFFNDTGDGR